MIEIVQLSEYAVQLSIVLATVVILAKVSKLCNLVK